MFTSGVYNVHFCGAAGDGIHDDTVAIQTAIDDCAAGGGGSVILPRGIYLVSQLTLRSNVALWGILPDVSILRSLTPDLDVLLVDRTNTSVQNLGFDSSVPRASGRYIYLGPASRSTLITHFRMEGAFQGIGIDTSAICTISVGEIINGRTGPNTCGIEVLQGYDLSISAILMDNPTSQQPAAGIRIFNSGDLTLTDCNLIHCTNALHVQGAHSLYADNCFFDNSVIGILLDAESPIERCHFLGCWTSSHSSHGFLIRPDAPQVVDTIDVIGHHSFFNSGDGIHIGKGNNIKVTEGSFCANLSGIAVGAAAQQIMLANSKSGSTESMAGNQYGVYLITGADFVSLIGCNLLGNTRENLVGSPVHFINMGNFF